MLPTLGPWHSDPELSPQIGVHIHYHPQFFDLGWLRRSAGDLPPERVLMVVAHMPSCGMTWDVGRGDPLVEVELECLREMPDFPRGHESAPWLPLAEEMYAGDAVRLERGCVTCPHRGTRLDSLPWRERPGLPIHRECIHGLRWGEGGRLVR